MSYMLNEINEQPELLCRLPAQLDPICREIASLFRRKRCNNIVIAGRGTSDHAGIFGQYLFTRFCGKVAALAVPSALTLYGAAPDFSRSLVIGLSQSGQAADVLAVIEAAKASGAVTVSITNDKTSPLAKAAAFHLFCDAGEEISVAATKTFTAEMMCIAMLAAAMAKSGAMLRRELMSVGKLLSRNMPIITEATARLANRCRFMTDGFVLARGTLYPIALETALKIKETNYIRMQGAPISDFYHGPMAQVQQDTPVIVYAMQGPAFDDAVAVCKKLHEAGADVLAVTDSPILAAAESSVLVKAGRSDISSAFTSAVFAQLFACSLAGVRGKDPDAPRLLKKVTVTR